MYLSIFLLIRKGSWENMKLVEKPWMARRGVGDRGGEWWSGRKQRAMKGRVGASSVKVSKRNHDRPQGQGLEFWTKLKLAFSLPPSLTDWIDTLLSLPLPSQTLSFSLSIYCMFDGFGFQSPWFFLSLFFCFLFSCLIM